MTVHITIDSGGEPKVTSMDDAKEAAHSRARAEGTGQEPKSAVNYRAASTKQKCGNCIHGDFDAGQVTGSCSIVAGSIRATWVCDRYEDTDSPGGAT